ncbi:MAG: metallophosphoesterase family protein, partial [Thermoanaerobaculia bacterium]
MVRIAHISDTHVLPPQGVHWREMFFNKRITGWANTRFRRGRVHRRRYLEAVLDAASRADHLVVTGDVTNLALEGEFHEALRLFESRGGGAEITVIPGNHDLYLPKISREGRFEHHFGAFLQSDLPDLSVGVAAGNYPFVKLRGPVAIIGLSSAVPRPPFIAAGYLGDEQLRALRAILEHPEVAKRFPVML